MGTGINGQKGNKNSKYCQIFSTHKGRQIVSNNMNIEKQNPILFTQVESFGRSANQDKQS